MSFEKVTEYLDSLNEQFQVRCCDCIVLKNHEVVYRHLNGTMDVDGNIPLTEENFHDIYSASKVMTVIAVMQLVEQGKIDLDDELGKYLSEYQNMDVLDDFDLTDYVSTGKFLFGWPEEPKKPVTNKITLRTMLSMAAGFTYHLGNKEALALLAQNPHATTREFVNAWSNSPLLFEPGTRYAYSYALDILGVVVEVVSGMRFADYKRTNVFEPVGAMDMYYHLPQGKIHLLTELYAYDAERQTHVKSTTNLSRLTDCFDSGGAGIVCTVESYSKVLDALANDGVAANGVRILTKESIDEIKKNRLNEQQLADFHIGGKYEYGYGYGVRTLIDETKSKSPIGEFGWDGAAGAYVLADTKNQLAIFYVQAAPESGSAFSTIHPTLRDLVYEAVLQ